MLQLTILGTNAASPAHKRHPTAQVLSLPYTHFLIDCGEGTQIQMQRYRVKINKLKAIFITHLHGDHYLGLIGLLSTMHLIKRVDALDIYAPPDLADIIRINLKCSDTRLSFPVHFHPVSDKGQEIVYEDGGFTVETIKMNHRIACVGYLFREKPKKLKVLIDKLPEEVAWQIPAELQKGRDYYNEEGGILYKCEEYTYRPPSLVFAHCSDTLYNEAIIPQIEGADLLYHESTFLHEELEKANMTHHSTALQAATIAHKAKVKKLVIGHYSARYKDLQPLLEEARTVFENTHLAIEGEKIHIERTEL